MRPLFLNKQCFTLLLMRAWPEKSGQASPWAETFLLIRKKRKQGCSTLNGKTDDDIRMKCRKMQEMPSSRLRPQAKSLFPLPGLSLSPVALISSISQKARLATSAHVVFGTLERRRVRGLAGRPRRSLTGARSLRDSPGSSPSEG